MRYVSPAIALPCQNPQLFYTTRSGWPSEALVTAAVRASVEGESGIQIISNLGRSFFSSHGRGVITVEVTKQKTNLQPRYRKVVDPEEKGLEERP